MFRFGVCRNINNILHKKYYNHLLMKRFISNITLPQLGDSITEGQIVEITMNVGDHVNVDDVVAIVETDKVSVDVRSDITGQIKKILVSEGDNVPVGASLIEIDDENSEGTQTSEHNKSTNDSESNNDKESNDNMQQENNKNGSNSDGKIHCILVPSMGDSITEGEVSLVLKKKGDHVTLDEVIAVLETDKVSVDITSTVNGIVDEVLIQQNDIVNVDTELFKIKEDNSVTTTSNAELSNVDDVNNDNNDNVAINDNQESLHRVPLIQFRHGKANQSKTMSKSNEFNQSIPALVTFRLAEAPIDGPDFSVPYRFRRNSFKEAQIEAIESGFYME